jgi:prepilin signal peptidase PulO-like enzyme (type II secretory pathway)
MTLLLTGNISSHTLHTETRAMSLDVHIPVLPMKYDSQSRFKFYDMARHDYFFCCHTSTVCHDVPGSSSRVIRSGDRYLKIPTTCLYFTLIYDLMCGHFGEHPVSMKMNQFGRLAGCTEVCGLSSAPDAEAIYVPIVYWYPPTRVHGVITQAFTI